MIFFLWLSHYYPVILHVDYEHGSHIGGHDILENAFFIANTIVAIATPFILLFAIRQFQLTENTSRASVYLELGKRYHDDDIRYARQRIAKIERDHKVQLEEWLNIWQGGRCSTTSTTGQSLQAYAQCEMMKLRAENAPDYRNPSEYSKIIIILSFLEDLGVLYKNNYVAKKDIVNLMYGTISTTEKVLRDHIIWLRKDAGSDKYYANMLTLVKDAKNYESKMTSFNEVFNKVDYRLEKSGK
jgi:hypothetical protein